jgi:hypothetical protein
MVFDGNKWQLQNRQTTIDDLYDNKKDILVEKFDELVNTLPEHAIKKFKRFLNDEQDDKIANTIKEELKLTLYNNKNIPEATKEKLGLVKNATLPCFMISDKKELLIAFHEEDTSDSGDKKKYKTAAIWTNYNAFIWTLQMLFTKLNSNEKTHT